MKSLRPYQYFWLFALAGYLLTLFILGFLPVKDKGYFEVIFYFVAVSMIPMLFITFASYRLCGRKIVISSSKTQAVQRGITSALMISFFTPMTTSLIFRLYEKFAEISSMPQVVNVFAESLFFGIVGTIYGLLGSLVFGSLLGATIYGYKNESMSKDLA